MTNSKIVKPDKISRGFVGVGEHTKYLEMSEASLLKMLQSTVASERTIAIRCLHQNDFLHNDSVEMFCKIMAQEKALYVRLELENVLTKIGGMNLPVLLKYLGKVGNNQHKTVGQTSRKRSYPLPRDQIARIIGHISAVDVEELYLGLNQLEREGVSELIDGIGFFAFYNSEYALIELFKHMKSFVNKNYSSDELIQWKFYTYCSAFATCEAVKSELLECLAADPNNSEILRSLSFFEI